MNDEPARDDNYKEIAKLTYDSLLEMRRLSFGAQADYGKWLISSIFVMHGSAIAGLAFKASTSGGAPPYLAAISWFVVGLVLALASGFAAWWNFSLGIAQYETWARPSMLFDRTAWPSTAKHIRGIKATRWMAITCGVGSVILLVLGSLHVLCVWK